MPHHSDLIHFQHPSRSPGPLPRARFPCVRGGSVSERPLDQFQSAAITGGGAVGLRLSPPRGLVPNSDPSLAQRARSATQQKNDEPISREVEERFFQSPSR